MFYILAHSLSESSGETAKSDYALQGRGIHQSIDCDFYTHTAAQPTVKVAQVVWLANK